MKLTGKTIVVLVEQDYQDMEVWFPVFRLREEGARVLLVGTGSAMEYRGKYGYPAKVDAAAKDVKAADVDGIVIPGGWAPDKLRMSEAVLSLVREVNAAKKPIACICHGAWVLASAGIVKGRTVTSYAAIKDDLIHAGANWQDREVVVDGNLVTSRQPDDLPAFMREYLKLY
ncbi:type 1 glutamine amidotransferase [bacterium]|nr:type 1 glutamine amidotransferase [bacterium]MBU1984579.1 type 1 glutamine amidotransferase [bacterium]